MSPEWRSGSSVLVGMKRHTEVGLAALILISLWSCDLAGPRVCADSVCESGLTVELTGDPASSFTITVEAQGIEPRTVVCSEGAACDLFFEGVTASTVRVSYQVPGMLVVREFTPQYSRVRPNGEDCPPECLDATVVLEIPTISA